jgi:hypothetical protein
VGDTAARVDAGVSYTFGGWGLLHTTTTSSSSAAAAHINGDPILATTPPPSTELIQAQHWLEDIGIPLNFAKPQAPVEATVLGQDPIDW